jgi:hypothetical protein
MALLVLILFCLAAGPLLAFLSLNEPEPEVGALLIVLGVAAFAVGAALVVLLGIRALLSRAGLSPAIASLLTGLVAVLAFGALRFAGMSGLAAPMILVCGVGFFVAALAAWLQPGGDDGDAYDDEYDYGLDRKPPPLN